MNVSFLVVGGGSIGERHLRCAGKAGYQRLGIIEPRDERRAELSAKYDAEFAWRRLEDADCSRFTHAIVATPPGQHLEHTRFLVAHGLHVLTEKPLCASLEDAAEFVNLARTAKVTIRVAFTLRSFRIFREVKDRVARCDLGTVKIFHVVVGQHFPTFRPDYLKIYWADPKQGGCCLDAMSHMVDMAQWQLGELTWVGGMASNLGLPEAPVDDSAAALLRGPSGEHVSICVNQFQAPNESLFTWVGTHGSAVIENPAGRLRMYLRGDSEWRSETFPGERDDGYVNQARLFVDETQGTTRSLCTVEQAAANLHVCLKLRSIFGRA
ncbi:MAG: Gfo/Idh/MocA family oxidoreductase [Verrucomicrobia bacterium]|nr:Gfo/Idh/MocA family oxidoreductase [Verrucomicrobiota bacterium]